MSLGKAKILLILFWVGIAVMIFIALKHITQINKTIEATK